MGRVIMALAIPPLNEKGIPGRFVNGSHPDVDGKFGGHKAWIVRYQLEGDNRNFSERMEIYRHVGPYNEVGSWPPYNRISKWEMATTFIDSMNEHNFSWWSIFVILWMMIKYKMERL